MLMNPKIQALADRYGIKIVEAPGLSRWGACGGCDIVKRELLVDPEDDTFVQEAVYFHEISHIICAVPWLEPDEPRVTEEFILLQFEDILAAEFDIDPWQHEQYRDTTYLMSQNRTLSSMTKEDWRNSHWWNDGLQRALRVGLIDEHGKSTGRYPDWSKMTLEEMLEIEKNWRV